MVESGVRGVEWCCWMMFLDRGMERGVEDDSDYLLREYLKDIQ
jgi:hypothetical protein